LTISDIFHRHSRRSLLIEINPYQILAAGLSRPNDGPIVLECAAEFDNADDKSLHEWLEANFEKQKAWLPVIGGFVPPEALLQRESLQPRKLTEPDYLANLVREQYKIEAPDTWKIETLSQLDGLPIAPEGTQRPALICGVSHNDVHRVQQRLLDHRLLPYRLEMSTLPLIGIISDYKARRNDKRAIVVVVIEHDHTVAYILGKEGVHTPGPVRHGFASIAQAAHKEFGLDDAAAVRERLQLPDEELLLRATKFVRAIGRDLKPLVDSYEMTTGQPVGEIYCAYLPPQLSWIVEPLAQVVGRTPFTLDCQEWLGTVNLQAGENVPAFGRHWLGALSLIADVPHGRSEKAPAIGAAYKGPWHLDCRLSAHLPSNDLIRGRFVANALAATLAAAVMMFTFWLLYSSHSLAVDTAFWEQRMRDNKPQIDALNATTRKLELASDRLDQAYGLVATPFVMSDFILDLGRSRPTSIRIDNLDSNDTGVVMRGSLQEPSEQASRTLGRYVEQLRRDGAIAPYFASITLSSLDRSTSQNAFTFEITFKLKRAKS
jgi:hypothetical protein